MVGAHGGGVAPPASSQAEAFNFFRAEDYGARGLPEKVDSSGAINLAVAIAAAAGGGLVMLDAGKTYGARLPITLQANVELVIPTGTTLQAQAGLVGDLISATNAAGVRISGGGTIDANRAASGSQGNGVTLTNCPEAQLESISVINAYVDGVALVNCTRAVCDLFVGANGRHGIYHNGSTFCRGQLTARDNGQRMAGSGIVFDGASTDNSYAPAIATDSRAGGAKTQQYGMLEVAASACDRNTVGGVAFTGNAVGTLSLVGANSGTPLAPGSVTSAVIANGAVTDAAIQAGGLHNASLATDVARANQLVNGGFEVWQRGNGPITAGSGTFTADRWAQNAAGSPADTFSTTKDTTHVAPGSNACLATTFVLNNGAGFSSIGQVLKQSDGYQVAGATISFSIIVNTATVNAVHAAISSDGTGGATTYSAFHPGDGTAHLLTVTATLPANATYAIVAAYFTASCTAYLDNAMCVFGSVAPNYVPLPPADDLAWCLRYYQRWQAISSGPLVGGGMVGNATRAYIVLTLQAKMGGTPTLTVSSVGNFAVWEANTTSVVTTAITLYYYPMSGGGAALVSADCAGGLVAGNATMLSSQTGTDWLALEWNP